MSWRRFQNECWFALRPTGFRQATGLDSADPNCVLPKDERGDDVLDGRENRAAETSLDGRQERKPDREPARQRPEPQRRDRKGSSAWPGRARQVSGPRQFAPPLFGAVAGRASSRRAADGDGCAPDDARRDRARDRPPDAGGRRAGGVRERRRADVAQGDDHRTEGGDVPLAAGRPGQLRNSATADRPPPPVRIAPTTSRSPTSRRTTGGAIATACAGLRYAETKDYDFVFCCSGTTATKQEPWFTRLVMVSLPRWRVRMCLTIARPRPVPFLARLWVASTR